MKLKFKLIITLFLLCNFSIAQNSLPIEITADKMEWSKVKNVAIATGNAKAVQGDLKLSANKIVANLDKAAGGEEITSLDAEGKVTFVGKNEIAYGNRAFYDLKNDVITITGKVNLKKEDNIMVGEKLVINFKNGVSELTADSNSNKVKMKFNATKKEVK